MLGCAVRGDENKNRSNLLRESAIFDRKEEEAAVGGGGVFQ